MVLLAPAIALKLINPKSLTVHIVFLLGMKASETLRALQQSDERQVRYKSSYHISPQVPHPLGHRLLPPNSCFQAITISNDEHNYVDIVDRPLTANNISMRVIYVSIV